jgi:hypothetical protein
LTFHQDVVSSGISTLGFIFFFLLLKEILLALLQITNRCPEQPQWLQSVRLACAASNDCGIHFGASSLSLMSALGLFFSV